MSDDLHGRRPVRDASVVVARDDDGLVALLSADFPRHGGDYLFLPSRSRKLPVFDSGRPSSPDAMDDAVYERIKERAARR
ncbi:hypothetical protein RKE29_19815 [Streptomyces sp. B1866]|uniref:hypothetical protein n=1 Tax=Streptomyces sp. B1866 TaxID=3075431 RepID=UPI0028914EF3|nr:hypothetical protein [Streptomyces sp. B1866]MDT3398868.1 hypothetical protein [Streptomyces sp. B1866]